MFLTALNFMDNAMPVLPSTSNAPTSPKPWWWNAFAHPILSPVLWGCGFMVSSLIILWSSFGLILPSISHGFVALLLLLTAGLSRRLQKRVYVKVSTSLWRGLDAQLTAHLVESWHDCFYFSVTVPVFVEYFFWLHGLFRHVVLFLALFGATKRAQSFDRVVKFNPCQRAC